MKKIECLLLVLSLLAAGCGGNQLAIGIPGESEGTFTGNDETGVSAGTRIDPSSGAGFGTPEAIAIAALTGQLDRLVRDNYMPGAESKPPNLTSWQGVRVHTRWSVPSFTVFRATDSLDWVRAVDAVGWASFVMNAISRAIAVRFKSPLHG